MKPTKPELFKQIRSSEAERYAKDMKGLPDIDSEEHAHKTLKKLETLYKKYKKDKDEQGIQHVLLTAEIGRNQAQNKGLIDAEQMFAAWLEERG